MPSDYDFFRYRLLGNMSKELPTLKYPEVPACEECRIATVVYVAPVRTSYADGNDPQPILCQPCIDEWNEYWDDMWDTYHSGSL